MNGLTNSIYEISDFLSCPLACGQEFKTKCSDKEMKVECHDSTVVTSSHHDPCIASARKSSFHHPIFCALSTLKLWLIWLKQCCKGARKKQGSMDLCPFSAGASISYWLVKCPKRRKISRCYLQEIQWLQACCSRMPL